MRVNLMPIKACELGVDNFIYIPKKKAFVFADDIDKFENHIIIYSELGISENVGIDEVKYRFKNDEIIYVLCQYTIKPIDIFRERLDYQKSYLNDLKSGEHEISPKNLEQEIIKTEAYISKLQKELKESIQKNKKK